MAKVAEMYERYQLSPSIEGVRDNYSGLYSIHPMGLSPSVWNITQGGVTIGGGVQIFKQECIEKNFKKSFFLKTDHAEKV